RVGRTLAGLQRQQDAGGVERVEEAEGVADEHPAVAGALLRPVRIVLGREDAGGLARRRDAVLHARTVPDLFEVRPPVVAAALPEQLVRRLHYAAADDVVVQRDVPEPALAGAGLDDERGPLVAAGVAVRALPVGPDRALVEDRVPHPQAEPVHQQAVLAAGVDDDLRAHLARGVALPDPDADGAAVLEQHVVDADPLSRIDA